MIFEKTFKKIIQKAKTELLNWELKIINSLAKFAELLQ
jgi:hypothetical protein